MNILKRNTFPVYAFPASIRYAVIEIQQNIKALLPLIASSAFGSLSLAIQGLIDVRLPYGQVRPVSLFMTRAERLHETPSAQSSCAASFSWKG